MSARQLPRNMRVERGFTIVELMVAMTLALLVTAAIGALYVSSKQTFRLQDNSSGMDEVLRAIEEDMSREIRKAGYFGCFRWKDPKVNPPYALTARLDTAQNGTYTLPKDGADVKLGPLYDVRGGTATTATVAPLQSGITIVGGSEYVSISYGQPVAYLSTSLSSGTDPLLLNGKIKVKTGQPLLVSSCDAMTLMRSDGDGDLDVIPHDPAAGDNTSLGAPDAYPQLLQGSTVMKFQSAVYFLGTQTGVPQSLYVLSPDNSTTPAQPLAANVEQLNFLYGLDTGGSSLSFVAASTLTAEQWASVRAVRVGIVMRSAEDSLSETATGAGIGFTWDAANGRYNSTNTGTDRRLRKAHVFTVAIRGRTAAM